MHTRMVVLCSWGAVANGVMLAALGLVTAGCGGGEGSDKPTTSNPSGPVNKLVGVYPDKFQCASIATAAQIGTLLGGTARSLDNMMAVPRGVPQPCNFQVDVAGAPEAWTFDIDCRDDAKKMADRLFAQYLKQNAESLDQYAIMMDAGYRSPADAAPSRAPSEAHEVPVGARGLDHNGQGLLFWDDDAPCYVRVVGPSPERRLLVGQHVAKALTLANAPMVPRAAP